MMNRMVRMFRRPSCGTAAGGALRPSSPKLLPPRSTCMTVLLTRKASARACRVGTTHMAKWTADPFQGEYIHETPYPVRKKDRVPEGW